MTIDSFIQIAALIIAIYALVPRARQLELRIRIGLWETLAAIVYLLIIVYLLFYDTFLKFGIAPEWHLDDAFAITPATATFPISVLFLLFLFWRLQSRAIPRKSIYKFQELAEEFLQRGEYSELIVLLDRYWESLLRTYFGSPFLHRFKSRLEKLVLLLSPEKDRERYLKQLTTDQLEALRVVFQDVLKIQPDTKKNKVSSPTILVLRNALRKFGRVFVQWLMKLLPDYGRYSEVAGDLIRAIVTNEPFVAALSRVRPYFALRILQDKYFPQWADFLDVYLKSLIRNPQSVLYYEVANIQ